MSLNLGSYSLPILPQQLQANQSLGPASTFPAQGDTSASLFPGGVPSIIGSALMDAAPGSSSSTSNDGTSNDALLKALDSASSALQAATTAIGTIKGLISGGAGAAKGSSGDAKGGAGATKGSSGDAKGGAGAAKGGSGYAKGGAGAAKGGNAAKGDAGAAKGGNAAKGDAGAAKGANGGATASAGANSIDSLLAELMQLLNSAGATISGTTGAAKGAANSGATGAAKGAANSGATGAAKGAATGGTTGAAKGAATDGSTGAALGGINLANTGLMGAIAGTASGTPSTGVNLGNTGLISGNTGIVPPGATTGATGAAAAAASAAAAANPGGQKLAIFSAVDYKNFILAGSQGGTQGTDQLIDSRFADPTARFANASNQDFQAAVAGMYANQFKGFALGLDVAFAPGKNIDAIAANLVTAGKTQMTPEAELLSKVAATYRGNLTTGGPNLYNNAALKALLIKWGRTDLANQPSVGSQSGDVQTLGSVIKALNEETDPAIRKAWMQDIFDFAGNTPSSPSGAVPSLPQYQQAVSLVKGGGLDLLLANYLKTPGIF
jgi:hypothetical protein